MNSFWTCKTEHTFIFLKLKLIEFKIESTFKMTILHLSIHPSEPYIFAIFKPKIFKFWILIEDYMRINETLEFFDLLSLSSVIELGLGPSQINIFFIIYLIIL
jgi:hypothetical protein